MTTLKPLDSHAFAGGLPVKLLLVLAWAICIGIVGDACAQTEAAGAAATKKLTTRSVSGTVKSSSLETVVIAGNTKGRDAEWTFAVEPTTHIRRGGKSIVAGDLKPGDVVQVSFTEQDGKATARSILVKSKTSTTSAKKQPKS